jgi:hypothetical protein
MICAAVPHISECWPEGGLIGPKHVVTIKYQYLFTVDVLTVTLQHFVLLFRKNVCVHYVVFFPPMPPTTCPLRTSWTPLPVVAEV